MKNDYSQTNFMKNDYLTKRSGKFPLENLASTLGQ